MSKGVFITSSRCILYQQWGDAEKNNEDKRKGENILRGRQKIIYGTPN